MKLSVALATYNEEGNIGECLRSIRGIADEIIIVDGSSTDRTVEIARSFGAKVLVAENPPIFHINKQKAIDMCKNQWVLQLDADETVTPLLAKEIKKVINMSSQEIEKYQQKLKSRKLFLRHQRLIELRDGKLGTASGEYAAFFIPRLNYFLGKYLRYGGVYPDGVIRLIRKDKAYLPCKDVHEQFHVEGKVGWLGSDLLHKDSPNFRRYIAKNARYINLLAAELKRDNVGKNPFQFFNYLLLKPIAWFLMTQIRHKGILDGFPGVVFSFFSALRFPRAYIKYLFSEGSR